MQSIIKILLLFITALSLTVLLSGCAEEGFTYQVNDVASDPGAFSGKMTIVGIVNAYSPQDPTLVGIMDKKELQCTTPNCNKVLLPVRFNGERPKIGDEVKVSGTFIGGKLFQAETLKIVATHNLGGQG